MSLENNIENANADGALFFCPAEVNEVLNSWKGVPIEEAPSSDQRVMRVIGLMGIAGGYRVPDIQLKLPFDYTGEHE